LKILFIPPDLNKAMEGYKAGHIYFASESVGEGHPDKLCDQISDGILDAAIKVNPDAKVAMESATKSGMVSISYLIRTLGRVAWRNGSIQGASQL
jgi:S-adenosylmethionine synthetase